MKAKIEKSKLINLLNRKKKTNARQREGETQPISKWPFNLANFKQPNSQSYDSFKSLPEPFTYHDTGKNLNFFVFFVFKISAFNLFFYSNKF